MAFRQRCSLFFLSILQTCNGQDPPKNPAHKSSFLRTNLASEERCSKKSCKMRLHEPALKTKGGGGSIEKPPLFISTNVATTCFSPFLSFFRQLAKRITNNINSCERAYYYVRTFTCKEAEKAALQLLPPPPPPSSSSSFRCLLLHRLPSYSPLLYCADDDDEDAHSGAELAK